MNKYRSVNYIFNEIGERLFNECVEREDFTLKRTYEDELSNLKNEIRPAATYIYKEDKLICSLHLHGDGYIYFKDKKHYRNVAKNHFMDYPGISGDHIALHD